MWTGLGTETARETVTASGTGATSGIGMQMVRAAVGMMAARMGRIGTENGCGIEMGTEMGTETGVPPWNGIVSVDENESGTGIGAVARTSCGENVRNGAATAVGDDMGAACGQAFHHASGNHWLL